MFRQLILTLTLLISLSLSLSIRFAGSAMAQQAQATSDDTAQNQEDPTYDLERLRPKVKLGSVPAIELGPREPLTKEKATQIKACIARLADIDAPDFGLSTTMSGTAFLPLPNQQHSGAMILTDHQLKSSAALKTLVEIGPEALPFLLGALGDKTPTKLKLERGAAMWLANELWGNPVNELEIKVLGPPKDVDEAMNTDKRIESYTVKIGDVCLVAIGQIVGRGYQAVRYQPTACIVINSPTEDVTLREQVRKIWTSDEPARKLLNTLLLDYATEGVFQGPSLDSWNLGSELQIQAAMRLLYFFPKESTALIAERLRKLDVNKTSARGKGSPATEKELDASIRREVANGVRTDEFIKAVSWCRDSKVREAIRAIFTKTGDIDVLLAALPGIDDTDHIRDRLQCFLDALPMEEGGAYGDGHDLLVAMAERLGKNAVPTFTRYLKDASAQRGHSAAEALRQIKEEWCVPILIRLLNDTRPLDGYTYAIQPDDQDRRLPMRVCDAAAESLQVHRPDMRFTLEGEYKDLDEQIKVIREKVVGKRQ
ncbi:MAG TPA: hypothetical protein VJZ71_21725 [Phycisphaerae bacterium]|nr:hypothetical protein [Phycisphaerae bacterium]